MAMRKCRWCGGLTMTRLGIWVCTECDKAGFWIHYRRNVCFHVVPGPCKDTMRKAGS